MRSGKVLVFLTGNHEEVLLQILDGDVRLFADWLRFGGAEWLRSYGADPPGMGPERGARGNTWFAA